METILSRKIGGNRVVAAPIPEIEDLANRMSRAFETALARVLNVSISAMVLDCEVTKMMDVAAEIPAPAMLGVFDFVGADYGAMVNMTSDLAYHVIDLRMGGDPADCPTPTTRSFTAIDEALCEGVLREFTFAFERATEQIMDGPLTAGFEFKGLWQDVSAVSLAPDRADVLKITVALDIGLAARGGDIEFIVPLSALDFVRSAVDHSKIETNHSYQDIWKTNMRQAVRTAELPVTAVLARVSEKPEMLKNLQVGTLIPLSSTAPKNVQLEIGAFGKGRIAVATARLGGFDGSKVLKLNDAPSQSVIHNIRRALEE